MIAINTSIVSGVALSEIDGEWKLLLMKRVKGNFWCHVAGSMESTETAVETIVREFHEETKIVVDRLYNPQFTEQFYEPNENVIEYIVAFVAICPPNQKVALNEEHTEYRWCSLDEALALAPYPNQHALFKHVWSCFIDKPVNERFRIAVE